MRDVCFHFQREPARAIFSQSLALTHFSIKAQGESCMLPLRL
jgi:hypothetical protein